MKGFFGDSSWKVQKAPPALLPECGKCGLHRLCKSPFMKPTGQGRRKVLVVAEAPGETEDERGYQLVGNAGVELARLLWDLGVNMRRDCRLHNAVACRPHEWRGGRDRNRTPTKEEVDYCRPNLVQAIRDFDPDVILPLGLPALRSVLPLAWRDGEADEVGRWAGWRIPSVRLNCWVCPTYHPSFLLRGDEDGGVNKPNRARELHVRKHLKAAFALSGKPWPDGPPDYQSHLVLEGNPSEAAVWVRGLMRAGKPLAFDFETTTLKPDGPHAAILCCSVSDGEVSVAFPWQGEAVKAVKELVQSNVPKFGANQPFEHRWCMAKLGCEVNNWDVDCVTGAHWEDCRGGICSVKFQAFVRFGVPDYDAHVEKFRKGKDERDGNSPNRLREVEPRLLWEYCATDSLLEHWIASEIKGGMGE